MHVTGQGHKKFFPCDRSYSIKNFHTNSSQNVWKEW